MEKGYCYDEDDFYGVAIHPRAKQIADYEFFWDCVDEIAPFGSDEGYTAFSEFCDWRENNTQAPMMSCLEWIFESWKMTANDYTSAILEDELIEEQLDNDEFDFSNGVIDLDTTIIGTGFGQLIVEGKIDEEIKPYIELAIERQLHPLVLDFHVPDEYIESRIEYMQGLKQILQIA